MPSRQRRPTYDQTDEQKDPRQRGAGLGDLPKRDTRHGDGTDPAERDHFAATCTGWAASFTWPGTGERMARLLRAELDRDPGLRPGGLTGAG